jgi:hypothetical protein
LIWIKQYAKSFRSTQAHELNDSRLTDKIDDGDVEHPRYEQWCALLLLPAQARRQMKLRVTTPP